MKIRNRISLWVTLAGLSSSLILSLVILLEKREVPYELLDIELSVQARLVGDLLNTKGIQEKKLELLTAISRPYWMKLIDDKNKVIFNSYFVRYVELPVKDVGESYTVETGLALRTLYPEGEDDEEAAFRMRVFKIVVDDKIYQLQLARPIESIESEYQELNHTLIFGLLLSLLFLVSISYYVAGKILHPIKTINTLAHNISEKTLSKRIPLGKSKDELYELAHSLNIMFDRLQYSFNKQKEFVANASHELKTPLSILRLSMEESLQQEDIPDAVKMSMVEHCNILLRLSRLVESLLNLSALELSNNCNFQNFSLNATISSVVAEFITLIDAKSIALEVNCDEEVRMDGDQMLIQQIVINLLDNAIKYNEEGGTIRIDLQDDKSRATFQVFNTGEGVPLEDQRQVFDQFYRVEKSRAQALGGIGLGLTIVKKIVELHSGEIELHSKPGSWTQVCVMLPKAMVRAQ